MGEGGVENKPNAGTGRGPNLQQKGEFEYFDYTVIGKVQFEGAHERGLQNKVLQKCTNRAPNIM